MISAETVGRLEELGVRSEWGVFHQRLCGRFLIGVEGPLAIFANCEFASDWARSDYNWGAYPLYTLGRLMDEAKQDGYRLSVYPTETGYEVGVLSKDPDIDEWVEVYHKVDDCWVSEFIHENVAEAASQAVCFIKEHKLSTSEAVI